MKLLGESVGRALLCAAGLVAIVALLGCGDGTEYAASAVVAERGCRAPVPEVGTTTLSADGTQYYWSECWVCDDGTGLKRTWGPIPRDGQSGSAITSEPSADVAGGCE